MEDLNELAHFFLRTACLKHGKNLKGISDRAMEYLSVHSWPGNVRELSNVIERAAVFALKERILPDDLPAHLLSRSQKSLGSQSCGENNDSSMGFESVSKSENPGASSLNSAAS